MEHQQIDQAPTPTDPPQAQAAAERPCDARTAALNALAVQAELLRRLGLISWEQECVLEAWADELAAKGLAALDGPDPAS